MSAKYGVCRLKMVTRSGSVVKIELFSLQSGDEIRARRQKIEFFAQKGDEIEARRQNRAFSTSKW